MRGRCRLLVLDRFALVMLDPMDFHIDVRGMVNPPAAIQVLMIQAMGCEIRHERDSGKWDRLSCCVLLQDTSGLK